MTTVEVAVAEGLTLRANVWAGRSEPPFLLVHGLASNARLWDGVAEALAQRGHRVVAVDQRGHGRSDKPDAGYDFATLTDDLITVIDILDLDRPVAAGQSWGGNVVLELGARHPERVRGVACVDGGTIELSERFPDWEDCASALSPPRTAGTPAAVIEGHLRRAHPDWPEAGIQGALACFELRDDATVAPWLTFDRHMTILRELWQHHPSRRYPDVRVPVLLLPCDSGAVGWTADKRRSVAQAQGALPKARTHWFTAHHDVHAQHPQAVADVLLAAVDDGFFPDDTPSGPPARPASVGLPGETP